MTGCLIKEVTIKDAWQRYYKSSRALKTLKTHFDTFWNDPRDVSNMYQLGTWLNSEDLKTLQIESLLVEFDELEVFKYGRPSSWRLHMFKHFQILYSKNYQDQLGGVIERTNQRPRFNLKGFYLRSIIIFVICHSEGDI